MVRVSQMTLAHDRRGPQLVYNCGRVRFQGLSQRSVMALMGKSGLIIVRVAVEWGQLWRHTDAQTTCGHNRPGNKKRFLRSRVDSSVRLAGTWTPPKTRGCA